MTKKEIRALRAEAVAAYDVRQVTICDAALAGDAFAIEACRRVIEDARTAATLGRKGRRKELD
jgi:hypothetical protein